MTTTKEKTPSSQPSNVPNMKRSGRALLPPTYHVGMADQPIIQAQLMSGPFIQSKLTVNQPGDVYEREADAVADKVMRMPTPSVNTEKMQLKPMPFSQIARKCATCGKEDEDKHLHRKENASAGGGQIAPPIVNDVIGSSGQPLDKGTRQFMESRMGHDFSNVQVHTDNKAAESATSVNALAYTSGNHIVFNRGQYAPDTEGGKRLLAHELVHTVQQGKTSFIQRKSWIFGKDCYKGRTSGVYISLRGIEAIPASIYHYIHDGPCTECERRSSTECCEPPDTDCAQSVE